MFGVPSWLGATPSSWAHLGSNQGPLACEASALPLSYAPRAKSRLPQSLPGFAVAADLRGGDSKTQSDARKSREKLSASARLFSDQIELSGVDKP
jgi:hypothetical protein